MVSHPDSPPATGMSVSDSSHLSLSPGNAFNQRELSHPKLLHLPDTNSLSHVPHGYTETYPYVSRKYNSWGHPNSTACCGISWGLAVPAVQFNSSFAWFHFPSLHNRHWSQGNPLMNLLIKNLLFRQSLLLEEHAWKQKSSLTPHKTRSDIRSS